jgi:hypothetical protein
MTHLYLDSQGIWALYEQTVNDVENEFDRLYRIDPTGSLDEKTNLARRLSDLLGLGHMSPHAASGRSKRLVEEIKAKLSVDEKVARLIAYQKDIDPTGSLVRLEIAVRKWRYGAPNMALVDAYFNMPQFYEGVPGEALTYQTGIVEFEFCGSIGGGPGRQRSSFCSSATDQNPPCIIMAANLSKFRNLRFGKMTPDSPDAAIFHSLGGHRVPLHVLGTLAREKNLFRLKPLTIWRYDPGKGQGHTAEYGQEPARCPDELHKHPVTLP